MAILFGILFFGGNFYAYDWLSRQQSGLEMTYAQMRADQGDAELDLQKSDLWAKRKAWLQSHEPALEGEDATKAKVLENVLKGARDHHLEVLEQSLSDVQRDPANVRIGVAVKVKGGMEDLCQWLTTLQKPENFYAVSAFSLKADQDQKSMVCTLQLACYFKGGS